MSSDGLKLALDVVATFVVCIISGGRGVLFVMNLFQKGNQDLREQGKALGLLLLG